MSPEPGDVLLDLAAELPLDGVFVVEQVGSSFASSSSVMSRARLSGLIPGPLAELPWPGTEPIP